MRMYRNGVLIGTTNTAKLPEGFLDDVPDAVLLLEQQLRHGALHALFTDGPAPAPDTSPPRSRA